MWPCGVPYSWTRYVLWACADMDVSHICVWKQVSIRVHPTLWLSFITEVEYTVSLSIKGSAGASRVPVGLLPFVLRHRGVHAGQLSPACAHQKRASGQHYGSAPHTAYNQGKKTTDIIGIMTVGIIQVAGLSLLRYYYLPKQKCRWGCRNMYFTNLSALCKETLPNISYDQKEFKVQIREWRLK